MNSANTFAVTDSRHPSFLAGFNDWELWRLTYRGGTEYRDRYLERFNTREDNADFLTRSRLTPIPSFAKAAINDIRNSIFQRMRDITRVGGSEGYRRAVAGNDLGVDRRGSSMNAYLGMHILSELLVMGRCGIFVDNSVITDNSVIATQNTRPYLYTYQVEDILSWSCTSPDHPSEFKSILLRDSCLGYDQRTRLPTQTYQRYRMLWLDDVTGKVMLQFYNMEGKEVDRDGELSFAPTQLDMTRIPFVMPDLGDSLIKDVCNHQIALLNLTSRDVWYALQANFPFYVEQRDFRSIGNHLKQASTEDGTASTGGQGAGEQNITVGATHGRAYGMNANEPNFIAPPSEPLMASIKLQEKFEDDIRKLVNLSVQTMASRGSAESKSMDNQGLEAGLSFIGLCLESTERTISEHWSAYEERNPTRREIPTVKYPDRYSLKTDADRIAEAKSLAELIYKVPGHLAKKEIAKNIVTVLLGGKVAVGTIDKIHAEIDRSTYLTSDPDTIIAAVEASICSRATAAEALGFDGEKEAAAALVDAGEKIAMMAKQQGVLQGNSDPGARGVPELSVNPKAGADEKAAAGGDTRGNNKQARVSGASKKE